MLDGLEGLVVGIAEVAAESRTGLFGRQSAIPGRRWSGGGGRLGGTFIHGLFGFN